jgi:hypothetical protein
MDTVPDTASDSFEAFSTSEVPVGGVELKDYGTGDAGHGNGNGDNDAAGHVVADLQAITQTIGDQFIPPVRYGNYRLQTAIHVEEVHHQCANHIHSVIVASAMAVQRFQFAEHHRSVNSQRRHGDDQAVPMLSSPTPSMHVPQQQRHNDPALERLKVLAWPKVPEGGPKNINITVSQQNIVPLFDDIRLYQSLVRDDAGNFGAPNSEIRDKASVSIELNDLYMSVDQALSLRQAIIRDKAASCRQWVFNHAQDMHHMYFHQGMSAVDIANKYDVPPLTVLGTALAIDRGYSESFLDSDAVASVLDLATMTDDRHRQEFKDARARDCTQHHTVTSDDTDRMEAEAFAYASDVTPDGQALVIAPELEDAMQFGYAKFYGTLFELKIRRFLDRHGIRYIEEEDLRDLQQDLVGRTVTPDFVLLDRVVINGADVAWIDAKGFYGHCVQHPFNKLYDQAAKYNQVWGCGAFLFQHGFSEAMLIPGTVPLDFQAIANDHVTVTVQDLDISQLPNPCAPPPRPSVHQMDLVNTSWKTSPELSPGVDGDGNSDVSDTAQPYTVSAAMDEEVDFESSLRLPNTQALPHGYTQQYHSFHPLSYPVGLSPFSMSQDPLHSACMTALSAFEHVMQPSGDNRRDHQWPHGARSSQPQKPPQPSFDLQSQTEFPSLPAGGGRG